MPLHSPVVRLSEMKLNTAISKVTIPDIFACWFKNRAPQKLGLMVLYVSRDDSSLFKTLF